MVDRTCPPRGGGLYGMGAFLQGAAATHGKTEWGGCDTITDHVAHNINHLSKEEQEKLKKFLDDLFRQLGKQCEDDYCKEDAFADVIRARDLYDNIEEEFSRTDVWEAMDHALDELGSHTDRYDKSAAHKDSMDEVNHIFKDYEKEFLPKIMNRQCEHGVYNDTATQLLLNNAYAETVNKAATLVLNTYEKYEKLVLEGASLEIGLMRDFMNHVYRMTKLTLDQINMYFTHVMQFADLALKAMRVAIDSKTVDDMKKEFKQCYGKKEEHSINLNDWFVDMGLMAVGLALMKEFVFPKDKCADG